MDDHNLFFTGYQKKIKKMLKFEVISFIGRIFSPKIRLSKNKYIQIGCGSYLKANFENIDFYPLKLKDINIKNKVFKIFVVKKKALFGLKFFSI